MVDTGSDPIVGRLVDAPLAGLAYRSASAVCHTGEGGSFAAAEAPISFELGAVALGEVVPSAAVSLVDLASKPDLPLTAPAVTNLARLLHALERLGRPIDDDVHGQFTAPIAFDVDEDEFAADVAVAGPLSRLGVTLPSGARARNEARRRRAGIQKELDVAIPMRDGVALLADVFRPTDHGPRPAIVRLSVYGKAFGIGSICTPEEAEQREIAEDVWFEDKPKGLPLVSRYSETAVGANASDWVPRGYVLVRVDPRGVGHSPGVLRPYSRQEAEDYYDVIEWVARQSWCDGKVGTFGASYAATTQFIAGSLRPPSLAAMIPFAGDADAYRELASPGGILQEGYRTNWWSMVTSLQCSHAEPSPDFVELMRAHPFDDPDFYGPGTSGLLGADLDRIDVPFLAAVSQTGILHGRAGFEAFARAASSDTRLLVVDTNYPSFLYRECLPDQLAFFDRHLKGTIGAIELPPVQIVVRLGDSQYEWRAEDTWPIPDTEQRRLHLDASTASPGLVADAPEDAASREYAADEPTGASFTSEPLAEDLEIIGHMSATLWVSSTSHDADVYVSVRVVDPSGAEVSYAVRDRSFVGGITWGCLKVSQRATDPARRRDRPWHTHLERDRAVLHDAGEVVPIEVELMPTAVRVPAGHRLRVDVQPLEGPGGYVDATGVEHPTAVDPTYHDDARNTVHTGGPFPSHITLPVVSRVAAFDRAGLDPT